MIAAITETAGISIPPIPIERMNGSGRMIMLSRPTATVEPETITDRPAWLIVSTTAVLAVAAVADLLAEAEDHQQRVVDRDAEPDERDQELDDDRDVRDVGQRQISVNVFRIEAAATISGNAIAGSVPKVNSRMTSAPSAPISVSTRMLGPLVSPPLDSL